MVLFPLYIFARGFPSFLRPFTLPHSDLIFSPGEDHLNSMIYPLASESESGLARQLDLLSFVFPSSSSKRFLTLLDRTTRGGRAYRRVFHQDQSMRQAFDLGVGGRVPVKMAGAAGGH